MYSLFSFFKTAVLKLSSNERKESDESSSLHRCSKLSLALCGNTCLLSAYHSTMRIQKFLQNFSILIIDMLYIVFSKITLFHNYNCLDVSNK
jgi:hypothetical protein